MGVRDNDSTSPDIIQARVRSGRFQNDLNIGLALSKKQSVDAGGGGSVSPTGIASVVSGTQGSGGGDSSGSTPNYCFAGYTLVRMADGYQKPIRETQLFRDHVAVPTSSGVIESGQIISRAETMYSSWMQVFFKDEYVEVQYNHRYRTENGEYAQISEIDRVLHLNEQGLWVVRMITRKIEIHSDHELDFYNFGVRHPARAYIAAGDWVSNAKPRDPNEY